MSALAARRASSPADADAATEREFDAWFTDHRAELAVEFLAERKLEREFYRFMRGVFAEQQS